MFSTPARPYFPGDLTIRWGADPLPELLLGLPYPTGAPPKYWGEAPLSPHKQSLCISFYLVCLTLLAPPLKILAPPKSSISLGPLVHGWTLAQNSTQFSLPCQSSPQY